MAALASTILGDLIMKHPNPYCDLYSPSRLRSILNLRSMYVSTSTQAQGTVHQVCLPVQLKAIQGLLSIVG